MVNLKYLFGQSEKFGFTRAFLYVFLVYVSVVVMAFAWKSLVDGWDLGRLGFYIAYGLYGLLAILLIEGLLRAVRLWFTH